MSNNSMLFSPVKIGNIELKNRLGMSPMCTYSSIEGLAGDWHFAHYTGRSMGGIGLQIVEATAVSPEGRISQLDLGIWSDEHIAGLERIAKFALSQKCIPAIQLAHAGRKASTKPDFLGGEALSQADGAWLTLAPSSIPFLPNYPSPKEMTKGDISNVVSDFAKAAVRAKKAGFKIVEIHAAHGYLIHEFLSPLTNKREDEYGGCFENRTRFALEILHAMKEVLRDDIPIIVRISAADWIDGGWDITQSIALSMMLKESGAQLIDVSSGGLEASAQIPVCFGYQTPFSYAIRHDAKIKTAAVGLINDAIQAETLLATGHADIILMGRQLLREPYFAYRAAAQLNSFIEYPIQYERARIKM